MIFIRVNLQVCARVSTFVWTILPPCGDISVGPFSGFRLDAGVRSHVLRNIIIAVFLI